MCASRSFHSFNSVDDEVKNHLLQVESVTLDRGQTFLQGKRERNTVQSLTIVRTLRLLEQSG